MSHAAHAVLGTSSAAWGMLGGPRMMSGDDEDEPRRDGGPTRSVPVAPPVTKAPSLQAIEERVALDDHSGAVLLARERLSSYPADEQAAHHLERGKGVLVEMLEAQLGGPRQRLRVVMSSHRMQWLSIDHRAGFLVSRIVGDTTVEDVLQVSGMDALDTLRILVALQLQGVIELVDGAS